MISYLQRFSPPTGKKVESKVVVCIPLVVACFIWDLGLFCRLPVTSFLFPFNYLLIIIFFHLLCFFPFFLPFYNTFSPLIVLNKIPNPLSVSKLSYVLFLTSFGEFKASFLLMNMWSSDLNLCYVTWT